MNWKPFHIFVVCHSSQKIHFFMRAVCRKLSKLAPHFMLHLFFEISTDCSRLFIEKKVSLMIVTAETVSMTHIESSDALVCNCNQVLKRSRKSPTASSCTPTSWRDNGVHLRPYQNNRKNTKRIKKIPKLIKKVPKTVRYTWKKTYQTTVSLV